MHKTWAKALNISINKTNSYLSTEHKKSSQYSDKVSANKKF